MMENEDGRQQEGLLPRSAATICDIAPRPITQRAVLLGKRGQLHNVRATRGRYNLCLSQWNSHDKRLLAPGNKRSHGGACTNKRKKRFLKTLKNIRAVAQPSSSGAAGKNRPKMQSTIGGRTNDSLRVLTQGVMSAPPNTCPRETKK